MPLFTREDIMNMDNKTVEVADIVQQYKKEFLPIIDRAYKYADVFEDKGTGALEGLYTTIKKDFEGPTLTNYISELSQTNSIKTQVDSANIDNSTVNLFTSLCEDVVLSFLQMYEDAVNETEAILDSDYNEKGSCITFIGAIKSNLSNVKRETIKYFNK